MAVLFVPQLQEATIDFRIGISTSQGLKLERGGTQC